MLELTCLWHSLTEEQRRLLREVCRIAGETIARDGPTLDTGMAMAQELADLHGDAARPQIQITLTLEVVRFPVDVDGNAAATIVAERQVS
jgi:hypothetical protein